MDLADHPLHLVALEDLVDRAVRGFTNQQVANQMFISVHTVVFTRARSSNKLGITSALTPSGRGMCPAHAFADAVRDRSMPAGQSNGRGR